MSMTSQSQRHHNRMNRELIKKASKRKRRPSKSKKGRGIQDSGVFIKYLETRSRCRSVPTRLRQRKANARYKSPSARRDLIKQARELNSIVQDLKQRIASIPLRNRPVPKTVNPYILGVELKLRLAAKAPIIEENTGKGGKVWVRVISPAQRVVPVYRVNGRLDGKIDFRVRINRLNGSIKRHLHCQN